ncbi:MAG: DUF1592 domain-containing protein [Planctomycetes bacterium]|nr:DUF1592 domain-containing protein [Planctomycetota bacterium]
MPRLCALFLASCATAVASAQDPSGASIESFAAEHCLDCHGGEKTKGDLDLRAWPKDPVEWAWRASRVRMRVRSGEMPPPDSEPLSPELRTGLVADVDAVLREMVPRLPSDPGRVTVRRLSRTQWSNVVRDLFEVVADTEAFPADDLGYGFDTIGDATTFSTLHLEKYMDAARDTALAVFDGEDPARPAVRRVEAETMDLVDGPGAGMEGSVANLYTRATIEQAVHLPRDGTYRVVLRAGADQAGDEPAKMLLRLDGRDLETWDVATKRMDEFGLTAPLTGGEHRFAIAFVNDFYDPKNPDPSRRDRNLKVDWLEVRGPLDDRALPPARRAMQEALNGKGTDGAKLRGLVRAMLPWVHRRPVADDEVARYVQTGDAVLRRGQPLLAAARAVLQAALVSPHFLFRIEPVGSDRGAGGASPVAGPALAVRLSFFLWASTPDERLARLGSTGRLADAATLAEEVTRMLADPRAESLATEFAAQWLELRNLADRTPDPGRFPGFDDALKASLRRETELLFAAVLREDRDVRDLLDCEFTHVDRRLAAFYGLPAPASDAFERVPLPEAMRERGGVLGHASVLAVTSNPTRTSPVKRGKWILDNLLGQAPPPPPPGNDTLAKESEIDSTRSFREQLSQHRQRVACAGCHVRMDTLGFALERFDAIGRGRASDSAGPIDCSGELPGGVRIEGITGLKDMLREDPAFVHNVARKLFVYAVGRDARPVDRLRLWWQVDRKLEAGRVTLRDLVTIVVNDEAFRLRSTASAR